METQDVTVTFVAIFVFLITYNILNICEVSFALALTKNAAVEEECYDTVRVICSNYSDSVTHGDCRPQTITHLIIFKNRYFVTFGTKFQESDYLYAAEFVSFSLCHSEALMLTPNDFKCGQRCSVSQTHGLYNTIQVQCNESFPVKLNNLTILLFELNNTVADYAVCMNMTRAKYRFAIIDISGKPKVVILLCYR